MSGKFVCPFEDAVVYKIPDNYMPNLGSGSSGWQTTSHGVTHDLSTQILMDVDCLKYGTPENGMVQVNPNPNKNI